MRSNHPSLVLLLLTLQVLASIQFIWSKKLDHPHILIENILMSLKGEVKIGENLNTKA
jgi:hypothetical protein